MTGAGSVKAKALDAWTNLKIKIIKIVIPNGPLLRPRPSSVSSSGGNRHHPRPRPPTRLPAAMRRTSQTILAIQS
jgi:hypothetical protein